MIQVIYLDGEAVGFTEYDETDEMIFLHWSEIHPPYRRRGTWRGVIAALTRKAARLGKPLFIDFTPWEPEWIKDLYRGLGFVELFSYGPDNKLTRLVFDAQDPGRWKTSALARVNLLPDSAVEPRGVPDE